MKYQGGCHCGRIKYEVEGEIGTVIDSNCSLCRRRGSLLWFAPRDQFRLITPEADVAIYTFNTHKLKHHFCAHCGIAPYSEGVGPKGDAMAAINVRCLDGVDLATLTVRPFNGAAR